MVAQNIDDIVAIDPAQAYEFTSGELVTNIYDRLVQYDAEDPTVLAPGLAYGHVAIDPAQAYEFTSGELVTNIYDRLVQYDAEDPTVLAPGLATEWTIDAAAKTITFTLRDGAKFHSGNPVRAEDVVFSFARVVKLNLTPAFILTQLGWTPENVAEMVTADGNTVTVKYEGDFSPAFVMNVLASRPASVVDEVDGHGERGERRHGQRLDERQFRRLRAVLAAGLPPGRAGAARPPSPTISRARPSVDSVIIRHVAESATQQLLLQQGDVDMAKNLTPDQIAGLAGRHDQGRGLPAGRRALPLLQPEGRGAAARGGLGGGALPRRLRGHDRHLPQGPDGDPPGVLAQGLPRLARRDAVHLRPGEGQADPRRRRRRRRRSTSRST